MNCWDVTLKGHSQMALEDHHGWMVLEGHSWMALEDHHREMALEGHHSPIALEGCHSTITARWHCRAATAGWHSRAATDGWHSMVATSRCQEFWKTLWGYLQRYWQHFSTSLYQQQNVSYLRTVRKNKYAPRTNYFTPPSEYTFRPRYMIGCNRRCKPD